MARGAYSGSNYLSAGTIIPAMPFTMSCWVYRGNSADSGSILSYLYNSTLLDGWLVQLGATEKAYLYAYTGDSGTTASSVSCATGAWTHLAAVVASATSRTLYGNGSAGTTSTANRGGISSNRFAVGVRLKNSANVSLDYSYVCEIAIYDSALASDSIAQLSDGFSPLLVKPNSLISYWPLVRGNGSGNEADVIAGNTLTETGTVSAQTHVPKLILPRRSQRYMWAPAPTFSPRWVRSSHIISAGVQHA